MTPNDVRWLYTWPEPTAPMFRIGRCGDEFIAEWVGKGTFRASLDGSRRKFSKLATFDDPVAEHVLNGQLVALERHLRGEISLHASSVALGGIAVAFLGPSRAGKSTIAHGVCTEARAELLSDDMSPLQFDPRHVMVSPGRPDHALRPDIARALGLETGGLAKIRSPAVRHAVGPARLGACVALAFDDEAETPVVRRVRGAETFPILSRAVARFALDEPSLLCTELDKLARVVAETPFYEFRRSRQLSNLQSCAREMAQLLRSLAANRE